MKSRKIKDKEFLRNIIIGIVSLLVVAFIINISPGYKRDKYTDIINLVINEEDRSEELKHNIYINDNGTIYISEEDVRNLFDSTIYYDSKYNQIITTSDTKVANIAINEKVMTVNNSNVSILDSIITINNNIYLPISDMEIVYNIKIQYIKDTNKVIIDDLNKGMIKAIATEDTDIKFKPRGLSKKVGTLKQGESVSCFYTTSKGWRQIRTNDGVIGYIKANKLSNEYIIRQDMLPRTEATNISMNNYTNKRFNIAGENIVIKELFTINKNNIDISNELNLNSGEGKVWTTISNKSLDDYENQMLKGIITDYKLRTTFIDMIVKKSIENDIKGIVIDIKDMQDMKRFVIECAPKLREVGISTCVVINTNMDKQDYINIADYIVE